MEKAISTDNLDFYPLTPERWPDFVELFGANGAYGGCWCMYWRTTRREFNQNGGEGNKQAMKNLVRSGTIPGILGYRAGKAVCWCSVAPREDFASLERSRNLKRLDDRPVWSIVCFYVAKAARNMGLMLETIQAAVEYARANKAKLVEAYPVDVHDHHAPGDLYMGNLNVFIKAGFKVEESRGKHIMVRYTIE
jgi:GNAT superfamily N-acetyltransferase